MTFRNVISKFQCTLPTSKRLPSSPPLPSLSFSTFLLVSRMLLRCFFQRVMDRIFGDLPFCFIYLDNILVFSSSLTDHQLHLCHILDLCCLHGLTINLKKCVLLLFKLRFFGIQSPALGLLLSISTSPQSLLFCHPLTARLAVVPGDGELLQEVYTWSCSDPPTCN